MVSDPPGKYPHLGGGLSVAIDSSQPAGQRIVALQYNCGNISDTDMMQLAVNDFISGGGDGYLMLEGLPRVLAFGPSLDEALAGFISSNTPPGGSVRCLPNPNLPISVHDLLFVVCITPTCSGQTHQWRCPQPSGS
ncbi:MAG: hypothetical protein HC767_13205 [Akkermansiaceae bacterium]|nr:hypothetical protein [Akkermansiaceae bacterium]